MMLLTRNKMGSLCWSLTRWMMPCWLENPLKRTCFVRQRELRSSLRTVGFCRRTATKCPLFIWRRWSNAGSLLNPHGRKRSEEPSVGLKRCMILRAQKASSKLGDRQRSLKRRWTAQDQWKGRRERRAKYHWSAFLLPDDRPTDGFQRFLCCYVLTTRVSRRKKSDDFRYVIDSFRKAEETRQRTRQRRK